MIRSQAATADRSAAHSSQGGLSTEADPLIQTAMKHLGLSQVEDCSWKMIARGGSGREFYRVRPAGSGQNRPGKSGSESAPSVIAMRYSNDREENAFYPDIASFLRNIRVNVPRILFHDAARRFIILDDLGDQSLFHAFQNVSDVDQVESLYRSSLDQIRILHRHSACPARTMSGFDEKLYRWERHYFLENLASKWAGMKLSPSELEAVEAEGEQMAAELASAPVCLVHRDFQSQNLLVHEDRIWLIDFQGMRPGHAAYDLASLLYDPYVQLGASRRGALLDWYQEQSLSDRAAAGTVGRSAGNGFMRQFYCAAVQRLMQALGAYAFLGLVRGKSEFLSFIPRGLKNLADALESLGGVKRTAELVRKIRSVKDVKPADPIRKRPVES